MNSASQLSGKSGRSRKAVVALSIGLCAAALLVAQRVAFSSESGVVIPPPAVDEPVQVAAGHQETAVLAGGCFWGVQGVFQHVRGVTQAVAGYSGGQRDTAQYETVSGGETGHAESVQITYDPTKVTYGQLLQVYFSVVQDPTELNRQGPDSGTQYRSAIFPLNPTQQRIAQTYIAQLDKAHAFAAPIVTKTEPFKGFYPAESYHQNYLTLHPNSGYIVLNDLPKVANLKHLFPSLYRDQPALVAVAAQ
jgi:peptide-methionine (S)-S-oxide reductase